MSDLKKAAICLERYPGIATKDQRRLRSWLENIPRAPLADAKCAVKWKKSKLKRGMGGKVKSRKQAIAIGLSEAQKKGKKVPRRRRGPFRYSWYSVWNSYS